MENTSGHRVLWIIIAEVVIVIVVIFFLIFFFQIIPFKKLSLSFSPSTVPIPFNQANVGNAVILYSLSGNIKTIHSIGNGDYILTLDTFPQNQFAFNGNAQLKDSRTRKYENVENVQVGDGVTISVNYNLKDGKWSKVLAPPKFKFIPLK